MLDAVSSTLDEKRRSEIVADKFIELFWPSISFLYDSYDRANCQLSLTRLSVALALYRAEQGEYPEQLDDLVPSVIPNVPADIYSGKLLVYERKGDGGYLLYSVYRNGVDDNGTDESGTIIKGNWVDERIEDIDERECDLVIRVPVPSFKFPEPPSEEELIPGEFKGWSSFDDDE